MPNEFTFDFSEFTDLQKDIERLGVNAQPIIYDGAQEVGLKLDEIARTTYPPPVRRRRQSQYWTAKQTRAWWWAMNKIARGKRNELPASWRDSLRGWNAKYKRVGSRMQLVLSGSYRRTNTLVKSLNWRITQKPSETILEYGTNRASAKWVIDKEHQAAYHAGNWETLQDLVAENEEVLFDTWVDTVWIKVQKLLHIEKRG